MLGGFKCFHGGFFLLPFLSLKQYTRLSFSRPLVLTMTSLVRSCVGCKLAAQSQIGQPKWSSVNAVTVPPVVTVEAVVTVHAVVTVDAVVTVSGAAVITVEAVVTGGGADVVTVEAVVTVDAFVTVGGAAVVTEYYCGCCRCGALALRQRRPV